MILSLLLATMAQSTPAAPPAPPFAPRGMAMRAADTDNDGIVTRAEAMAQAEAMFARADTNHDGRLDADEQAAMRPRRGGRDSGRDMPPPPPAR